MPAAVQDAPATKDAPPAKPKAAPKAPKAKAAAQSRKGREYNSGEATGNKKADAKAMASLKRKLEKEKERSADLYKRFGECPPWVGAAPWPARGSHGGERV
jgi:hypothetical protein